MKLIERVDSAFTYILSQPRHLLILRLTLLALLFYGGMPSSLLKALLGIFCGIMIIYTPLTASRFMWVCITSVVAFYNAFYWEIYSNYHFLLTYWCIACTLAVFSKEEANVLKWNARLLIGLCFLFAALWKIIGGEYFDGTLQQFLFLVDRRIDVFSSLLGIEKEALTQNRELLAYLKGNPATGFGAALNSSTNVHYLSIISSYYTIIIESLVALSFLFFRVGFLEKTRDVLLIMFIVTVYFILPVPGFGFIVTLLGFAQSSPASRKINIAYLLLLIPLQLSTLPMMMPKLVGTLTSYLLPLGV